MTIPERYSQSIAAWRSGVAFKAVSFALVGVINTLIDATVFFSAYALIGASGTARHALARVADTCGCADASILRLILSNVLSWFIAVSCSYVMNSFITFAAESGGKLRRRDYFAFVASGVVGAVANTAVLVLAAQALPIWAAKGLAILTSFIVNFSLSHFVVFRAKSPLATTASAPGSTAVPPDA